jgi:hypothetical protein
MDETNDHDPFYRMIFLVPPPPPPELAQLVPSLDPNSSSKSPNPPTVIRPFPPSPPDFHPHAPADALVCDTTEAVPPAPLRQMLNAAPALTIIPEIKFGYVDSRHRPVAPPVSCCGAIDYRVTVIID